MGQRSGPKQSLSKHVAQPKQLAVMTDRQLRENECGSCQITYTEKRYAQECRAWHQGR